MKTIPDQEFLASFGVEIDESGVSRLQKILTENQGLAKNLAASFNAAAEGVKAFKAQVSTDLPSLFSGSGYGNVTESLFGNTGGLKIGLNMTEPKKEMASFTTDAKKPIALSANASAIVSAARTALENVRSLFSQRFVLNVQANVNADRGKERSDSGREDGYTERESAGTGNSGRNAGRETVGARSGGRNASPETSGTMSGSRNTPDDSGSALPRMATGGRLSKPTSVEVAEDGDAEYIIPVKKEHQALPLVRQMLGEMSPEARESLAEPVKEEKSESLQNEVKTPSMPAVAADVSEKKEPESKTVRAINTLSEEKKNTFVPKAVPAVLAEKPSDADTPLPFVREIMEDEPSVTDSVLTQTSDSEENKILQTEVTSIRKDLIAPGQEPTPSATIPDLRQTIAESNTPQTSTSIPTETEKEDTTHSVFLPDIRKSKNETITTPVQNTPRAVAKTEREAASSAIPNIRRAFAKADHPLASTPDAVDRKYANEAASSAPSENLSDLVSQLASIMQPVNTSVTNTSNNMSAPVTINVNAKGNDAEQIGRTIYDTAERYLIRCMQGAFT